MRQRGISIDALVSGGMHVHTGAAVLEHRQRRTGHAQLIHPVE
jgi:hypothetical protein